MTRFSITRRQALFLFVICTISSKLQTLPCLISEDVGSNLWLVLLFGGAIDAIFFALIIWTNQLCPNLTFYELLCKIIGKFFAKIVMLVLIVYFLFTALMPYEAVRNVFANNLFDTLPWQSFSIFLIFAVGYLVFCGLKTIGRSAELYLVILVTCVTLLFLLGIFTANFENILPLFDAKIGKIANSYVDHSLWFGDYMIFFCLIGRIDTSKQALKFWDVLIYLGLIAFYALGYVTFFCLYTNLAGSQTSLLSSISSFSLIELSIGRADWFLVLICQIASVLSLSSYTYCIADALNNIIGKKHYAICAIVAVAIIYVVDLFLFSHTGASINAYLHLTGVVALIVQTSLPVLYILCTGFYKSKAKRSNL